jgi:tetratricopeptide (TPR) repeat protein
VTRPKDKTLPDNVVPLRPAQDAGAEPRTASRASGGRAQASAASALDKALRAKSPEARVRHASLGLTRRCDVETQGLLLRQLYLGELESGHPERARLAAEQMVTLGVLPDVARHDAARACSASGAYDDAAAHLVEAARIGPPERRAIHLSALGGLLYAIGRARDAIAPLEEALACGGAPEPIVRGQLALARAECDDGVADDVDVDLAYQELANAEAGEGYGRFVLGELAFARGDRARAQIHLEAFLARARRSRPAAQAALAPEIARATATLGRIVWN